MFDLRPSSLVKAIKIEKDCKLIWSARNPYLF